MDEAEKRLKLIKKIESFRNYKDNWNGYGASPLSKNVIKKAITLASEMYPIPEAFPTACDSIQLEWEMENIYLELEIFEDETKVFIDVLP